MPFQRRGELKSRASAQFEDIISAYVLLKLPEALAQRFNVEVNKLETEKKMRYVTSIERMGHERGHEQGLGQGRNQGFLLGEASVLKRQLKRRFDRLPGWVEERLEQASRDELKSWADRLNSSKTSWRSQPPS